jgi:hypothetical protein
VRFFWSQTLAQAWRTLGAVDTLKAKTTALFNVPAYKIGSEKMTNTCTAFGCSIRRQWAAGRYDKKGSGLDREIDFEAHQNDSTRFLVLGHAEYSKLGTCAYGILAARESAGAAMPSLNSFGASSAEVST